jgi:outer membrane protein TolC
MPTPTIESLTELLATSEQNCLTCRQQLRTAQATIKSYQQTLVLIEHMCQDHPVITQLPTLTTQEAVLIARSTLTHILLLLQPGSTAFS